MFFNYVFIFTINRLGTHNLNVLLYISYDFMSKLFKSSTRKVWFFFWTFKKVWFKLYLLLINQTLIIFINKSEKYDLIILDSFLLCFSVIANGEKILNTKQAPGNIAAINGIRTISTTWVILGHTVAHTVSFTGNTKILIFFNIF